MNRESAEEYRHLIWREYCFLRELKWLLALFRLFTTVDVGTRHVPTDHLSSLLSRNHFPGEDLPPGLIDYLFSESGVMENLLAQRVNQ